MHPEYVNAAVTFVVGFVALVVYALSKRHEKKSAASIIVMDIRHAEQVILSLLERGVVDRDALKPILNENNWAKYKHLFTADFSYDDFLALNRFFDSCVEIAEARKRMNEVFFSQLNAKAEIFQQKLLGIPEASDTSEGRAKREKLLTDFNNEAGVFDPAAPKSTVLQHLQRMGKPSVLPAFVSLKKIARMGV